MDFNIGYRVSLLRDKYCDGSNVKFADDMGESTTTVSNWTKAKSLGRSVITKLLVKYKEIDGRWLILGEGEMLRNNIYSERDIAAVDNPVHGDNTGVIGNTGTVGSVGCNTIHLGKGSNVKKISENGKVEIELDQSVENMQQIIDFLNLQVKALEDRSASKDTVIESLRDQVIQLKASLADKDRIIELMQK